MIFKQIFEDLIKDVKEKITSINKATRIGKGYIWGKQKFNNATMRVLKFILPIIFDYKYKVNMYNAISSKRKMEIAQASARWNKKFKYWYGLDKPVYWLTIDISEYTNNVIRSRYLDFNRINCKFYCKNNLTQDLFGSRRSDFSVRSAIMCTMHQYVSRVSYCDIPCDNEALSIAINEPLEKLFLFQGFSNEKNEYVLSSKFQNSKLDTFHIRNHRFLKKKSISLEDIIYLLKCNTDKKKTVLPVTFILDFNYCGVWMKKLDYLVNHHKDLLKDISLCLICLSHLNSRLNSKKKPSTISDWISTGKLPENIILSKVFTDDYKKRTVIFKNLVYEYTEELDYAVNLNLENWVKTDPILNKLDLNIEKTKYSDYKETLKELEDAKRKNVNLFTKISKISKKIVKNRKDDKCSVCREGEAKIAFIPCGHRVICKECSQMIDDRCVLCGLPFTDKIRIY